MKVAIVHDWLYGGGAERVVQQLHNIYPNAPIYTSYCSDEWRKKLDNKVITGYLQHPPFKQLRKFLPLLRQWWFRRLDLSDFDLVISSSGNGEAKFVRVPNGTHVSYCHTPVHFYWRHYESYLKNPGFRPKWLIRIALKLLVGPLRRRDYAAAQKVDHFIANSSQIKKDIETFYNRESTIIFPPVDTRRFGRVKQPKERSGFVTLGRQVPMKRFDIVIQACNQLGLPLAVIGRGPEHEKLQRIAGPTVQLYSDLDDKQVAETLAKAEGFIFASFEDFGIAPVEAMAAGTPVIAYKAGGALDYVIPGKTGTFFDEQTVTSLVEVIKKFDPGKYRPENIKKEADNFSGDRFRKQIKSYLQNV